MKHWGTLKCNAFSQMLIMISAACFCTQVKAQNTERAIGSGSEGFPSKPIHWLVGFAPGGGTTITSRLVAQKMSERLGKAIVVDNRPGAEGAVAIDAVRNSAADGYTVAV